jgi:TPR repeat protein
MSDDNINYDISFSDGMGAFGQGDEQAQYALGLMYYGGTAGLHKSLSIARLTQDYWTVGWRSI